MAVRAVRAPRVVIDVSAGLHEGAGHARYVRELVNALRALPEVPGLVLYSTAGPIHVDAPEWLLELPRRELKWRDRAWRGLSLASQLTGFSLRSLLPDGDLVHGTNGILPHCGGTPTVLTIQDVTFLSHPEVHSRLSRFHLRRMVPRACRRAGLVVVPSRATAEELRLRCGVDSAKIRVVHDGYDDARFTPDPQPGDAAVLERHGIDGPFVLFVGTIEPRKNLVRLLEAFAQLHREGLPHRLALAGELGWGYRPVIERLASADLKGGILRLGRVADADLPALYRGAAAFVYPSLFEGFGLPVLEAMACGAPVITSNVSSLPEVAGEAALTVPPDDVAALAAALRAVLRNGALARRLRVAGPIRAASFTWRETARGVAEVYREAAEGSS